MNSNEEEHSKKSSKKFAVGDLPPSPTTSTGTIPKRPTRHHVKRRSSGRVHVSKLAPMARAHSSTHVDLENNEEKKSFNTSMKRSQSNKSLNRLSLSERGKNNLTGFTPANNNSSKEGQEKVVISPPTTPPSLLPDKKPPSFPVSHTIPAAPVEQTLTVTADDILVTHDNRKRKQLLKSQFVDHKQLTVASNHAHRRSTEHTHQQKVPSLQREQSLVEDENNSAHAENITHLARELERMGREYRSVCRYQDPMMDSLIRCQQQHNKPSILLQRTLSSASMTTTSSSTIPHMEQRRQILLNTSAALQQQQQRQDQQRWSAGNFIERLFFGTS